MKKNKEKKIIVKNLKTGKRDKMIAIRVDDDMLGRLKLAVGEKNTDRTAFILDAIDLLLDQSLDEVKDLALEDYINGRIGEAKFKEFMGIKDSEKIDEDIKEMRRAALSRFIKQ